MEKYFSTSRKCPLFKEIGDENLVAMLGCLGARVNTYNKKEMVLKEGEPSKNVGIVLKGSLQIEQTDYFGNRSIISTVLPSQLFGESFACAGTDSLPIDVIANEETDVLFIDCRRITNPCCNACGFHSQLIYNLMQVIAAKNIAFHQKLSIISKRTTRDKLMTYLMSEAKKSGNGSFIIPFDRQALADYLGVDRSGLSVEISKLQREGIIENYKNSFKLFNSSAY